MRSSRAPFEVPDIYSHTAATVPANLHYSVMVSGEADSWAFQQEHLEDQTQALQQCRR